MGILRGVNELAVDGIYVGEVVRGKQQRGRVVLCISDVLTSEARSMHMQRCADTLIQRDGATVSAAAVRNRVGPSALRRSVTWVVPRDSAAAVVRKHVDTVVSAAVRIADAIDALHGHAESVWALQRHTDVPVEEKIRWQWQKFPVSVSGLQQVAQRRA